MRWLNCGINGGINWPSTTMEVEFAGHRLVLMPLTRNSSASVSIELAGISDVEASTVVNRFLSTLSWKDDATAINNYGVSGTPIPSATDRQDRFPSYSPAIIFPNRVKAVSDKRQKLALALYREGMSLDSVPYQFLSFFKILNIFWQDKSKGGKNELVQGIRDILPFIEDKWPLKRIEEIKRNGDDVAEYLYQSGRCAIAHAYSDPIVDPDDVADLHRLSEDLWLVQALAGYLIEKRLEISKSIWE